MEYKKEIIGTKYFGPTIDITDPCYDKDVWCRMNGVEIPSGTYTCIAFIDEENSRVASAEISLDDGFVYYAKCEEIGVIGVDAGLAGFFNNKPDYDDDKWIEICNMLQEPDENGKLKDAWITEDGFFTSSGYGDGCYPVYVYKNARGQIRALKIDFYD